MRDARGGVPDAVLGDGESKLGTGNRELGTGNRELGRGTGNGYWLRAVRLEAIKIAVSSRVSWISASRSTIVIEDR